jgi:salicylate hydroxylase
VRRCGMMLRGGIFVRQPIEHWAFGRVVLLGDAAHAMAPFQAQGAAQAVEDAYVLGACIAAAPDDVEDAFRRYEKLRMDRAVDLQNQARDAGEEFFLEDGPEQRARDERFRRLPATLPFGTRQRVWEYDARDALAAAIR